MKLETAKTNNMQNDEHYLFIKVTDEQTLKFGPETLKIAKEYAALHTFFLNEDEANMKISKSVLTDEIKVADKRHDNKLGALIDGVSMMLRQDNPEVVRAARQMKIVLDTYGNRKLANKSLVSETSGVTNMVQDFTGKYAPEVATCKLGSCVSELSAANLEVERLLNEREAETAQRTKLSLRQCRANTDKAYAAMVAQVNALIKVFGEDGYRGYVTALNVHIAKYNSAVAQRVGIAKAKKKSETRD
jgi:hypothetical protein